MRFRKTPVVLLIVALLGLAAVSQSGSQTDEDSDTDAADRAG